MLILQPVETPSFVGRPVTGPVEAPKVRSLSELEETAVKSKIVGVLREVSGRLNQQGVRHCVLGAIAVGIHGWPRATRDVDLLLGPEAWRSAPDGTLTALVEMPEQVNGVGIDYLPVSVAGDFLIEAFDRVLITEGVPIAPIEVVILTKLVRLVMRDQADIVELLKAGLFDAAAVESYLEQHAPMLTRRFLELKEQAEREIARGS
ncbi:MAG TPA: hypothetical protein VJN18_33695 [Polyangiaceae bacterium]|nr:hypothetical protein [Polyangiaceae bacterium]